MFWLIVLLEYVSDYNFVHVSLRPARAKRVVKTFKLGILIPIWPLAIIVFILFKIIEIAKDIYADSR